MATYAGSNKESFYDTYYYYTQEGKLVSGLLFYPEYYRSMAIRLYTFDGSEVIPDKSTVISYEEKKDQGGKLYKEIVGLKTFDSYEEARAYIMSRKSGNYRIISDNPLASPVPLERLEKYEQIYSSDSFMMLPGGGKVSEIKIFKYSKKDVHER